MTYLNKVIIIGNVGNDPSISVMPSGKKCADGEQSKALNGSKRNLKE